MKGMWNSEKSVNSAYSPALDALRAVPPQLLTDALHAAVSTGAGLVFACTRDMGAVCITLLDGKERHKVYATDVQELHQALTDLIESLSPSHPPTQDSKPKR